MDQSEPRVTWYALIAESALSRRLNYVSFWASFKHVLPYDLVLCRNGECIS